MTEQEWTHADEIERRFYTEVIGAGRAKPQGILAAVDEPTPIADEAQRAIDLREAAAQIEADRAANPGYPLTRFLSFKTAGERALFLCCVFLAGFLAVTSGLGWWS